MSEHTPGPWVCNENEYDEYIWGPNREMIAESRGTGGGLPQAENRHRIVACVNACEGMKDPVAEIKALREEVATPVLVATNRLADALADARAENARLREVLSRLVTERTAGLASREAWDKARAALGKGD
jgi:hypothetical protein